MIRKRLTVSIAFMTIFICFTSAAEFTDGLSRSLLPLKKEFSGWKLEENILQYPTEEMWKHINGAAEQFADYGAESLTAAYLKQEGTDAEISIEIYRMKDDRAAFAIYSVQKPLEGPFLPIGVQGYGEAGVLNFFKGPFYVKLQVRPADDDKLEAVLRDFAGFLASRITKYGGVPEAFKKFPKKHLVEHSFQFIPKNALGIKEVNGAYTALYREDDKEITLHLIRRYKPEVAGEIVTKIRDSLEKRYEKGTEPLSIDRASGFQGEMKYKGAISVLRSRGNVVIVTGEKLDGWVKSIVEKFYGNLQGGD